MSRAVYTWGALGAAAGLLVALGDFAGGWSSVPRPADRATLLAALFGLQAPLGGLLGALLGGWSAFGNRFVDRAVRRRPEGDRMRPRRRLAPVPLVLLASPGLSAVAWLLFTGGAASRVPLRPLWVGLAAVLLVAGLYAALRIAGALLERARGAAAWAAGGAIAALAVHVGATLVDRHVLPGLYAYLHGVLTLVRWAAAAFALALVATRRPALRRLATPRLAAPAGAALFAILALDLFLLAPRQSLRVAMLSPRSPGSRSTLMALAPALAHARERASADAIARARAARASRRRARPLDGPTLPEAHLLLVTVDALRADHLGAYGYRRRPTSPRLDRLAAESIVFERAYAQVSHSSYSLSSLMTSHYLYQRADLDLPLPPDTLASVLGEAGYHTAGFYTQGIFHTGGARLARYRDGGFGFLRRNHRNTDAEAKTDEVLAELDAIAAAGEPPSFVWVHYFDVHEPYRDTRFGERDVERYDSEIRRVDAALARLVREARRRLDRPVIVAISADHGEEFRDHGGVYHGSTVYDEQVRVPLLLHVPGRAPGRVAAPVELVDLAPTLLGLLGVAPPPGMQGDDLRGLLEGDGAHVGPAFASAGYRHMIVRWPHKLIADLRFGTAELFDLSADPRERDNLADARPGLVDALRGEVRVWLDTLGGDEASPHEVALRRGRLRDRRAIAGLAALLRDAHAPPARRREAARLLGRLPGDAARTALRDALAGDAAVADEAAMALARLGADDGAARLHALLSHADAATRHRAALALARLRDRAAVPALLEALAHPRSQRERRDVIHALGVLGDPRAVEPLLALLDEPRVRRRAVLALGRLGDPRALSPLRALLRDTRRSSLRDGAARALGQLGDAASVQALVGLAAAEGTPSAAESLVRLGAVGTAIGGADVGPDLADVRGLTRCEARAPDHEWRYLDRTTCHTEGRAIRIPLDAPRAPGGRLLLRARRADAGQPVRVTLRLGDTDVGAVELDGEWTEHRLPLPSRAAVTDATLLLADPAAVLALDHLLLLPTRQRAPFDG